MDMTPELALKVLDEMAGRAHGTRADHAAVALAVQTLAALLEQPPDDDT